MASDKGSPVEGNEDAVPEVGVLPIEDAIDLHALASSDIPPVLASYLESAADDGFDEVRLIHGAPPCP